MTVRRDGLVWLLTAYLAVGAVAGFSSGLWNVWALGLDGDMQGRYLEYANFRVGDYPNRWVDAPAAGRYVQFTVYPPYALPMFAAFFEPGGLAQGRVVVELLSVAALVLMGIFGGDTLVRHGIPWGAVGALAAAAVTVNRSAISLGQFSIFCMGCIVLQIGMLERGRPLVAGACWAAAMIKPQIALPFAALFLVNRQWRGLLCGLVILAVLGAVALWWTEVSPAVLADYWLFRMQMRFAASSSGFGPAALAEWLGLNHRAVQYATLAALACATAAMVRLVIRDVWMPDLLPLAAICAVLGRVLFYHGVYDQIMLFPLLIACLSAALTTPGWQGLATSSAVAATLWVPQRLWEFLPGQEFVQPLVWIIAAVYVGFALTANVGTEKDVLGIHGN